MRLLPRRSRASGGERRGKGLCRTLAHRDLELARALNALMG